MSKVDWFKLSSTQIEAKVDKGLRHLSGVKPIDYLGSWLTTARDFAYATQDGSWGEFEKEFAIIIKRLVVAERKLGDAGEGKPPISVGDLVILERKNAPPAMWKVVGVYLGCVGQESLIELKNLTEQPGVPGRTGSDTTFVPLQLLSVSGAKIYTQLG